MNKRGFFYDLRHGDGRKKFRRKAEIRGFIFKKDLYKGQDVGNYEITKEGYGNVGRISEGRFLMVNSFPLLSEENNPGREKAINQLEEMAGDFVVGIF